MCTRSLDLGSLILFAACLTLAHPVAAQQPPPVPVLTGFGYWDHHWIQWLPTHPVYEAIEVMTLDTPRPDGKRLWRVFFTERTGGRRQVYYFNDQTVASRWPMGAHYREIEGRIEGEDLKPRGLTIKFLDKDNQPVEWTVSFPSAAALSAGDTGMPAHNHAVESVFLMFYLGPRALTMDAKLLLDDQDFSPKSGVTLPGRSERVAYTSGSYTATLTYGSVEFTAANDTISTSWARIFDEVSSSASGKLYRSRPFGFVEPNTTELETTSTGGLHTYRHLLKNHSFVIQFNPPLPALANAKPGLQIRYSISLDSHKDLLTGTLVTRTDGDSLIFDWQWESPAWAKQHPLESVLKPIGPAGYSLTLRRKP